MTGQGAFDADFAAGRDADGPQAGAASDDVFTVELDNWEGPLDLLLTLSRRQKVDLKQISILELVEQYLAYIADAADMKLEIAADYLVMAAWLAYLKSGLLLPGDPDIDPSAEELALRLQMRLQRLNAMREAAARLMARDRIGRDVFRRGTPEGLRTVRTRQWHASLYDLLASYGRVQARTAPVTHMVANREVMTLEAALQRVTQLVGSTLDWTRIEAFLPDAYRGALRKSALASSFLAALELARQGRLTLRQDGAFAPLYLRGSSA
ncbi:MAG: segregation/condensation protein A [Sphingomonadales bacterium]|nr:segregation/condensation protein A [Sphingomonadales bacterium]